MELPHPPAWYADEDLVPPPPPANANLRAFGQPDLDEGLWADLQEPRALCQGVKTLVREAVGVYADTMDVVAAGDPGENIRTHFDELDARFVKMHALLGKMRVHEGRQLLMARLRHETEQRTAAAAQLRASAQKARDAIEAMKAGPDAPTKTFPECSEEAQVARAMQASDEFAAWEASELARLTNAGTPPPLPEPWASKGVEAPPNVEDLRRMVDMIKKRNDEMDRRRKARGDPPFQMPDLTGREVKHVDLDKEFGLEPDEAKDEAKGGS